MFREVGSDYSGPMRNHPDRNAADGASTEELRLAALHDAAVLDTPKEPWFDEIAAVAARVCATPIALVSLVDRDRQWFKAAVGLGSLREIPRADAICSFTIARHEGGNGVFEIRDTLLDERFRDNPLVKGHPGVRFYAGQPLLAGDGHALGTLCVIDRVPRALDQEQRRALSALGQALALRLDLTITRHRAEAEFERNVAARTAALEEARASLEEAYAELETFSYAIAHDLGAPLRALNGYSSLLLAEHGHSLSGEAYDWLHRIAGSALAIDRMVGQLAKITRLSREKLALAPASLADIAVTAWSELAAERRGREIRFILGELPSASIDRALMAEAFQNLFSNAIKFTRDSRPAQIEVGCHESDGEAWIFVRDNGAGFDMSKSERLFKPFSRLHANTEFPGTGAGLAIVQRIVASHGGRIEAVGAPGRGATFRFTLGDVMRCGTQR